MQHISKKMQEMVDSLDKQAKTIKRYINFLFWGLVGGWMK
jgi:uncharacterized FlaG/YvyC family protein